jgi:hypothetical protein
VIANGRSGYISWIVEETSVLSDKTRVFTLPEVEFEFWTKMIDLETGYIRLVIF